MYECLKLVDLKNINVLATLAFMVGTNWFGLHPMDERVSTASLRNNKVFLLANIGVPLFSEGYTPHVPIQS